MLVALIFSWALAATGLDQIAASGAAPPVEQGAPSPPPSSPASPALPAEAPAPVEVAAPGVRLLAGTVVEVELVDTLSSRAQLLGDKFTIRLAQAISRDGVEIVAAGATGQGEVIDVARAGMGGKQGKLIISARYLDLNGRRVRVRGMTFMASGKSRVDLATGMLLVPYVGLAAGFVQGGEIELPAGARATVKLAEDVDLQVNLPSQPTGKL